MMNILIRTFQSLRLQFTPRTSQDFNGLDISKVNVYKKKTACSLQKELPGVVVVSQSQRYFSFPLTGIY